MATNNNRKQQRAVEREKHKNTYRILKEGRIWLSLVLVAVIAITVWAGIKQAGTEQDGKNTVEAGTYRETAALYCEGGSISAMTLSYYFYRDYYALINSDDFYTDGYGTYGLDPSLPLRSQEYTALRSYFDELMNNSSAGAVTVLQYMCLAEKNGLTLEKEDYEKIDAEIAELRAEAKAEGRGFLDYLDYRYCPGMTEEDVKYALECYYLAEKQYSLSTEEAMTYTDEEIADYYTENKDTYTNTNILRYQFAVLTDDDGNLKPEFAAKAERFAACADVDDFLAMAKVDLMEDQGYSESEAAEILDECVATAVPGDFNDEIENWLYDYDREKGDSYIFTKDGSCAVFVVLRAAGKYVFPSVNARVIYISQKNYEEQGKAKKVAEEVYALATENGTEEYFSRLVKEYSQDVNTVSYGGICEGIVPGDLNYLCDEWVFADGRKVGDIGLLEDEGEFYLLYCTGFGDPCWEVAAARDLISEKVDAFEKEMDTLIKVDSNPYVIDDMIDDDLGTEHKRGYTVSEKNGKPVYNKQHKIFTTFNIMLVVSVLTLGATVWCFVYVHKLKSTHGYKF